MRDQELEAEGGSRSEPGMCHHSWSYSLCSSSFFVPVLLIFFIRALHEHLLLTVLCELRRP